MPPLARALAAVALGLGLAPHLFADLKPKAYEIVTVADGVYGFVWKNPLEDPIEGNSLFIVNDHDVVVVDTGTFPSSARLMIAELRKLTDKPVRFVVNTHWHDDHHSGNFLFREAWPGAEIIAHRDTRADILAACYAVREKSLAKIDEMPATLERWIAQGKDDSGKPMDEGRNKRARDLIAVARDAVAELRTVKEAPPDLTFEDRLVLHRGSRTIEIRWLGRGNTRGDAIVLLPKEGILVTGDLVVNPVPFGIASYYEEWVATLGKLDALDAETVFLMHGYPQKDRAYLRKVQSLLRALVDQVKAAAAEGLTAEQAKERITLAEWKDRFAEGDPAREYAFRAFFVQPAVERAYRQIKGEGAAFEPVVE